VSSTSAGRTTVSLSLLTAQMPYSDHFTPRRTQPTQPPPPPSNLHRRMAARRRARRTDSPPDRPSARRGQPVRPCPGSTAVVSVLGRMFVYGEQCTADGWINLGGIRPTDVARRCSDVEGGSYCCNSYESAAHCHCCQVCQRLRRTAELVIERRPRRRFD